jgi:trimeric autotransporter adhesin
MEEVGTMERKSMAGVAAGMLVLAAGAGFGMYEALGGGSVKAASSAPLVSATAGSASVGATPSTAPEADAPGQVCTYGESGQDVQATLVSSADVDAPSCSAFAQQLSQADGGFWRAESPDASLSTVCVMSSGNALALTVRDGGGEVLGQGLCAGLQQNGWVEDPEAEQQDAQAAASASAAAAAASASAAAVAAQQAKVASDLSDAQSAMSAISSDSSSLGTAVQNAGPAVGDTATGLKQEQQDAANGAGQDCGNADTVDGDADTVVGDEDTLEGALDSVSFDIGQVRSDISALQQDGQVLSAEGVSVPSGAAAAISAGQQALKTAISQANEDIDAVAGDVSTAYQVAGALATGSCSGSGSGTAPSPPAQLS